MKITSDNLTDWPSIAELKKRTQSLAVLDAILEREWELRYYSFDGHWNKDEKLASMRNGQGSFYFILFNSFGAIVKGFDRSSWLGKYNLEHGHPWPGVIDQVPHVFVKFIQEPAFYINQATFCVWRKSEDISWTKGPLSLPAEDDDPDGSKNLLNILDGNSRTFQEWAEYYHERTIPLDVIEAIYQHQPITDGLIMDLDVRDKNISELSADLAEIGYPDT